MPVGKKARKPAKKRATSKKKSVAKKTKSKAKKITKGKKVVKKFPIHAVCHVGPGGKPCHGGSDKGNKCSGTIL